MKYTKIKLNNKTREELITIILKLQKNNNILSMYAKPITIVDGTKGMIRGE